MSNYILEMQHISKEFSGIYALRDVTLAVKQGEIHALCGENGAGKSTLMKILSGIYKTGSYNGEILIHDKKCAFKNVVDAEREGIAIIYQELAGEMRPDRRKRDVSKGTDTVSGIRYQRKPSYKNEASRHWRAADGGDCKGAC